MSGRARTAAGVAALLLITVTGVDPAGPRPAAAQESAAAPPATVQLTVLSIDSVVGPGVGTDAVRWRMLVENRTAQTWDRVTTEADLHARLGSRSALRAALAGGDVPPLLRRIAVEPSPSTLAPGSIALVEGVLPLADLRIGGGVGDLLPLRLRILADGTEVARLDTAVLHLAVPVPRALATTVVWPVDAIPSRGGDGRVAAALDPQTRPGSRLDTVVRTIAQAPIDTVTLAPSVTLLEDLAQRELERTDDDPGADRARDLLALIVRTVRASAAAPVALPYADADVARILVSPLSVRPLAAAAVFEGSRRIATLTGRSAAPVTLLEHPTDPRILDLVTGSVVLLPYAVSAGPDLALDLPFPDPVHPVVAPSGRLLTGVVADPFVTDAIANGARERFGGPGAPAQGGPVLAAHDVLVRTAMVYVEAPNRAGRSLLVLPPPGLDADPRFLMTLLAGFAAAPWLSLSGPVGLVGAASDADRAASAPLDVRRAPVDALAPRLVQAIDDVASARELVLDAIDRGAPGGALDELVVANRDLGAIADELLRATSRSTLTTADPTADDVAVRLEAVGAALRSSLGELVVTSAPVTLTAREGVLPLTLRHSGGVPLRLVVDVTGPAALSWPDGAQRRLTLAGDEERTLELPVRAGSTGTFPVVVRVSTTTGALLLDETLSVRATAVAGPALAGIGLVVVMLLVIGTIRQRRRSRRAPATSAA
jgi:hypothetical protein